MCTFGLSNVSMSLKAIKHYTVVYKTMETSNHNYCKKNSRILWYKYFTRNVHLHVCQSQIWIMLHYIAAKVDDLAFLLQHNSLKHWAPPKHNPPKCSIELRSANCEGLSIWITSFPDSSNHSESPCVLYWSICNRYVAPLINVCFPLILHQFVYAHHNN